MTDEGYLYDASDAPVPATGQEFVPLGAAIGGSSRTLEVEYDAAGNVTAIHDVERVYDDGEELEPIPYADPPAIEQARPYTSHQYPAPKVSRQPDTEWTIGDALTWLDPKPPRRTLSRWLERIPHLGLRQLPQGGPPARTYRARDVMTRHAEWAKSLGGNTGGISGGPVELGS